MGRSKWIAVVCCVLSTGCARACKNDHPYVPPEHDASADAVAEDAAAPREVFTAIADGGVEPATPLPPGTTSIDLDGATVTIPEHEIALELAGDFDGDGKKDALLVVRPLPGPEGRGGSASGELVHVHGGAPAPGVIASGPDMSVDPTCTPTARLERIGPKSAFAEIGSSCASAAGARGIWVVRLGPVVAPGFDASVADPPVSPRLTIDAEAVDRDKDGVDDVVLHVTLDPAPPPFEAGPRLTAKLAYFDRPAGPSRDAEEPQRSLDAIASQAASRAGKAKDAPSVPPLVAQMRSLYRALCQEGGSPRIVKIHGGAAPSCGKSKALERGGVAEVRALSTLGDAVRAYAAADLASASPATRTAAQVSAVDKLLADVAPAIDARMSRSVNAFVDAVHPQPEWGSLAFESNDKLLVRHGAAVSRVDLSTWAIEDTDVHAWPSHVVSPDGTLRWLEAYHACDGVAVRATLSPVADGDIEDVLLPVAPKLGSRCAGGRGEPSPAVPIAWGPRGLEALVRGVPVLIHQGAPTATALTSLVGDPPPRGSPRSANGRSVVVATPRGVLVRADRTTLRRAPELTGDLRGCATTDDGSVVACQKGGRVVVGAF